ncbi:unnamed protein product, partial [Mesorhabditis spiculigera]
MAQAQQIILTLEQGRRLRTALLNIIQVLDEALEQEPVNVERAEEDPRDESGEGSDGGEDGAAGADQRVFGPLHVEVDLQATGDVDMPTKPVPSASSSPSFHVTALAARFCLPRFTDIDYDVFTDAATYVDAGESAFKRATYRDTPVLAWILVPDVYWGNFGKYLFCCADILVAWLILPIDHILSRGRNESIISYVVVFWLANPLTAFISARGCSDSLVCAAVLFVLYLIGKGKCFYASLAHGALASHRKLYPVIYLDSVLMLIISEGEDVREMWTNCSVFGFVRRFLNLRAVGYALTAIGSFALIVFGLYQIYGQEFLEEWLLYHIGRRDIKHNFSPWFYLLYVAQQSPVSVYIGYLPFFIQIASIFHAAETLYFDLPMCWFMSTMLFVAVNKVSTSQYFIGYLVFLPFVASRVDTSLILIALWLSAQAAWLGLAYLYELKCYATLFYVWMASLWFFFVNSYRRNRFRECRARVSAHREELLRKAVSRMFPIGKKVPMQP